MVMAARASDNPMHSQNSDHEGNVGFCKTLLYIYIFFLFIMAMVSITSNQMNVTYPHAMILQKINSSGSAVVFSQQLVDQLVNELSSKDYGEWNDDIRFDRMTSKRFDKDFMTSAISNKSILFHGDSVIFYLVYSVLVVFADAVNPLLNTSLYINNSTERFPDFFKECCSKGNNSLRGYDNLFFDYFQHKYIHSENEHNESFNIIYTNLGVTHALQYYPQRDSALPDLLKHIETYIDRFIDFAIKIKSKCLIFRGVNPIADSRYNGGYKRLSDRYSRKIKNETYADLIDGCLERLNMTRNETIHRTPIYTISGRDICEKYTLSHQGSRNMNERYRKYVLWRQQELSHVTDLNIIFLDAFPLFDGRDEYSPMNDGRHYTQIKLVELYALFNVIQLWC